MIDLDRDLDVFFNADEFAVIATLSTGQQVSVIFDSSPEVLDVHDRAVNSDTQAVMVRAKDVEALHVGERLSIGDKAWAVASLPVAAASDSAIMRLMISPC